MADKNWRNESITKWGGFCKEDLREQQRKEEELRLKSLKEQIKLAEEQEMNEYSAKLNVSICLIS